MKIGYDARMLEHTGIGTRILNVLLHLHKHKKDHEIILFGNKELIKKYSLDNYYPIIEYNVPIYKIKEFFGHPKMAEMDLLDIPHFNVPLRFLTKSIVTIHDLIPYKMKEYFPSLLKQGYIKTIFPLIKHFSKKVISVSGYTKQDLVKEFHFKLENIQVIYNGINTEIFFKRNELECSKFKKEYNLPEKYILAVGLGKPHKNLNFVIKNLSPLWLSKELDLPLVIAGAGGKMPEYLLDAAKPVMDFLIPFPRLDYFDLPLLYQNAQMLIFPSLYEGFGFPPLEAAAVDCPVLSSNATVLPEVIGDSGFYFNPLSGEDFVRNFKNLIADESLRKSKIKAGRENCKRFSWETSSKDIIRIYESCF